MHTNSFMLIDDLKGDHGLCGRAGERTDEIKGCEAYVTNSSLKQTVGEDASSSNLVMQIEHFIQWGDIHLLSY